MMNHIVPDFEADKDYLIPELPKKSTMGGDEDIMELLWRNGQVVMQNQNQRSVGNKKPEIRASMANREIRSSVVEEETGPSDLFMQEDEMSSWLHYPVDDNSLEGCLYNNDLLYPTPAPVTTAPSSLPPPPPPPSLTITPPRPPVPLFRRVERESGQPKYTNFIHFSRPNKGKTPQLGPSSSSKLPPALKPSTVVESNNTPAAEAPESRASRVSDKAPTVSAANLGCGGSMSGVGAAGTSSAGRELETCELSVTSSPGTGGSGASASVEPSSQKPLPPPPTEDRKRKGREIDDTECHSEDVEFDYPDAKKQSHGATSTKRSRAAEVHNLSERSDKASMLDEAIEYLKSLQMQVQMMSMGCSMVPMMFPGVQQYMSPMAMGMGMGMGMNHAMVPYPAILPGSSLPNPAAQIGQRFPVPGFNMSPPVTVAGGPAASQTVNLSAPMMSSFPQHNQNQPRAPSFTDPFQQYLGLHQTQLPLPQNQGVMPSIATKPSSSKDPTNQSG